MFDIRAIAENPAAFDAARKRRGLEPLAKELIGMDDARRAAIVKLQGGQERRNAASKEIGQAMAQKDFARAEALKAEVAKIKADFPEWERQERAAVEALHQALGEIPNSPLAEVPEGADEHGNVEIKTERDIPPRPHFPNSFKPKEHFEIGEALGLMDFEAAAKMSGARFVVLKGALARLERALGQFMLDLHTGEHGYEEVNPPLMVRDEAMFGTAQLPKFREDQFFAAAPVKLALPKFGDEDQLADRIEEYRKSITQNNFSNLEIVKFFKNHNVEWDAEFKTEIFEFMERLVAYCNDAEADIEKIVWSMSEHNKLLTRLRFWLIPTAEVPLTNLVRESILDEASLPRRYTALTPCFRAEAGSAGRDTRGMIRQHQFTKVEMVSITTPESSMAEHERMTACAENVLKKLGLHFRTMVLCTGDMGFASQKTHDIEVWLPGQDKFREISSVSVCGDFQARRMNARYRASGAKTPQFVHTLNGSGVAVGRALVAVLENYQNEDGSVTVPEVLVPYMGGMTRIVRAGTG